LRRSTYPCQWAFFYPTFLGEPRQLAVAIVGSRRSTRAQLDTAFAISRSVIEIGGTVVTGMASGADTAAFDAARSTPHQLVLVLGTGVRRVFPSENTGAVRSHLSGGGAVITEMPPDHAPNAESFVLRNRIIAALADIVVAVSGEYSSGTSHTIKFAHALGRQLLSADPSPSSGITRLVTELGGTQVEPEAWAKFLEQG
jgi:predicted Rossmann fold nucleotide-binding protein DprA/Smf involved in DNA uptake